MDIGRDWAWQVLKTYVRDQALWRHCLAVEIAMRAYAEKFNDDVEYWGAVGILHDVDFEKYPDEHPNRAPAILTSHGYTQQFITDVLAHGPNWTQERTLIQKTLVAVDALTGFIIACALVRPDKSLENLEVKSIMKKFKDNAFARAVNREWITVSAQNLGVDIREHVEFVKNALSQAIKKPDFQNARLIS